VRLALFFLLFACGRAEKCAGPAPRQCERLDGTRTAAECVGDHWMCAPGTVIFKERTVETPLATPAAATTPNPSTPRPSPPRVLSAEQVRAWEAAARHRADPNNRCRGPRKLCWPATGEGICGCMPTDSFCDERHGRWRCPAGSTDKCKGNFTSF